MTPNKMFYLVVAVLIAIVALMAYVITWNIDRYTNTVVDEKIASIVRSADAAIADLQEHRPEVIARTEVIYRDTSARIMSLGADELATAALLRAERARSRYIASADNQIAVGGGDR